VRDAPDIELFLDFKEDRRPSMEVYAASLRLALQACMPGAFSIGAFRPRYPFEGRADSSWHQRYARYASYPWQARTRAARLNHIIDHGYAHLLWSLPPAKTVITVHDLIPLAASRGKIPGVRKRRAHLSELSARFLRHAAALISVSEHTRRDLLDLCQIPEALIQVIPLGVSPQFRKLETSKRELRARLGITPDDSFLVMITGTYFYKNHEVCLSAIRALQKERARACRVLWLGYADARADRRVVSSGLADVITGVEPRTTAEVVELYNACDCLLFPSLYEGFGWPPLEAMACGTPVVCSDAASLPELVHDAALTAAPDDVAGMIDRLRTVMNDGSSAARLVEKGLARARLYPWDRHARGVWDTYRRVLS
jgi:glycosyltransferase involved in cell wall biosynthesis